MDGLKSGLGTDEEGEAEIGLNNQIPKNLENWLGWAKKKADWYDPFVEGEDEMMEGVVRNQLS